MATWKEKLLDILKTCNIIKPELDKMTGKVTINFHEGKLIDCIVEPVIRIK